MECQKWVGFAHTVKKVGGPSGLHGPHGSSATGRVYRRGVSRGREMFLKLMYAHQISLLGVGYGLCVVD